MLSFFLTLSSLSSLSLFHFLSLTFSVSVFSLSHSLEELMDLDMEPKPESLWLTITYKKEETTLGSGGKNRDMPFMQLFDVLVHRFPEGLGAGKGGIELSHGPGNEWALVAGLPLPRGPLSQQEKPFSHRGRAVTKTERDVARE